jgi:hypothetical protein
MLLTYSHCGTEKLNSVLSSEMNSGFKEMENLIKGAGESKLHFTFDIELSWQLDRQGGIENVKRKRVEMEAEVTGQYEEFRRDFREACEKMQQPARLGKRFKFGPFWVHRSGSATVWSGLWELEWGKSTKWSRDVV